MWLTNGAVPRDADTVVRSAVIPAWFWSIASTETLLAWVVPSIRTWNIFNVRTEKKNSEILLPQS
jgi:hypothetical protein